MMIKYTPPSNKKQAVTFMILLLICFLTLMGFSISSDGFSARLLKTSAFTLFMADLLFVARYLTGNYTYILDDFELSITRNTFGKSYVVCRIYYTDVTDIKPKKEAKKRVKGLSKHNYCPSVYSKKCCYVFFESGDKTEVFVIEPDEFFLKALEKRVKNDIIL